MSRWLPLPLDAVASPAFATLSSAGRLGWLALRVAHARYGLGGVVPTAHATPLGLSLAAPAILVGVDVAAALDELRTAGLARLDEEGLVLVDLVADGDLLLCTRCKRRNPDPRSSRCPRCRSDDRSGRDDRGPPGSPSRPRRRQPADDAQVNGNRPSASDGQRPRGLAAESAQAADSNRSESAEHPQTNREESSALHARARGRAGQGRAGHGRAGPGHQTRACAREAPASPAGDPASPRERATRSPTVKAITGAWAVEMVKRSIEGMDPAEHADDVVRLLAPPVGTDPDHIHDPAALKRDRQAAAQAIIRWCPSPERLARWCVVVHRRYGARNVAGYLRRAAERGDPGTLLAQVGQGEHVLEREHEQALRGEHADNVTRIVGSVAAVLTAPDDETRARLRAGLRHLWEMHARCVRLRRPEHVDRVRAAARRVLLELVGDVPTDDALARAVDGILDVAAARRLLAA